MKALQERGYKPTAMQDEGWGDVTDKKGFTVLIKYEKQGKINKLYKTDAETFYSVEELEKFIADNSIIVLKEKDFKATELQKVLGLMKHI